MSSSETSRTHQYTVGLFTSNYVHSHQPAARSHVHMRRPSFLVLATLLLAAPPGALAGKKKKKKPTNLFTELTSEFYHRDLPALAKPDGFEMLTGGGVVAYMDKKMASYEASMKAVQKSAHSFKCLQPGRLRYIDVQADDQASYIHRNFHEDQANAKKGAPKLRERQTRMDVPFIAHFLLESFIPQPQTMLTGYSNFTVEKLVAWAMEEVCPQAQNEKDRDEL